MDPAVAKTPSRPQQSSTYLAQGHIMTNRTVAEIFLSYNLWHEERLQGFQIWRDILCFYLSFLGKYDGVEFFQNSQECWLRWDI